MAKQTLTAEQRRRGKDNPPTISETLKITKEADISEPLRSWIIKHLSWMPSRVPRK